MKLYIYDHCPYCIKAMMIFGLKNTLMEPTILLHDDIETPTTMIGKKMVPILEKADGSYLPESMYIVRYIDQLDGKPIVVGSQNKEITTWLEKAGSTIHLLAIPRTPKLPLPEFATESARLFFTRAKTDWLGDFQSLLDNTSAFLETINQLLLELVPLVKAPDAVNGTLSEDDFHLFAPLRVLSAVKGVKYPQVVDAYRQQMSAMTGIRLLDSVAL